MKLMSKKWKINNLEKKLNCKLKRNTTSIGFDVAKLHTGIAVLQTYKSSLEITKIHKINNKKEDFIESMEYYLGELNNFISSIKMRGYKIFVIENPWLGQNPTTLKMLQSFSTLTWRELKHIPDKIYFVYPSTVRKQIRFKKEKGNKTKAKLQVRDYLNNLLGTDFKDLDITDAIGLALSGLIKYE